MVISTAVGPAQSAAPAPSPTCTITKQDANGGSATCTTVGLNTFKPTAGGTYTIKAFGGAGGNGGGSGSAGGRGGAGAILTFTLDVKAGDTLTFSIGGKGADNAGAGGANGGGKGGPKPGFSGYGGGGGGGFTAVKLNGQPVAVAGGGGGGGGQGQNDSGWFGSCSGATGNGGAGGAAGGGAAAGKGSNGAQSGSAGGDYGKNGTPNESGTAGQDGSKTAAGCGGGSGAGGGGYQGGNAGAQAAKNKSAGGGGAGKSWADTKGLAQNTQQASGSTGNGKVTFDWVNNLTIATSSLPDAVYGDAYQVQLDASNPKGTVTWSLASGALPGGLTLSPAGVISGIPTETTPGRNQSTFEVQASDAGGNTDKRKFTIDEFGDPNAPDAPKGPTVTDAPATQITRDSAVGNGTVFTQGLKTTVWCQIADSQGAVDAAPKVPGNPSQVDAGGKSQQDFTCDFKNLEPNTTYFFRTYAEDADGVRESRTPQDFTTDGLVPQTANFAVPNAIAATGTTVVLPGGVRTDLDKPVTVSMQRLGGTKASAAKLNHDNATGQFSVVTDGEKFRIRLIWFASGKGDTAPLEIEQEYSSTGSLTDLAGAPAPTLRRSDLGKGWKKTNASALCPSPTGGATAQYKSSKVKREVVHEDAIAFDTKSHAKQALKALSKCVAGQGDKRVGAPEFGAESKSWNGRDPGHKWRITVLRKKSDVALVAVGFKGKNNFDADYANKVTRKAAKRL